MNRRLDLTTRRSSAVMAFVLLACAPWFDPWSYVPLALAGIGFAAGSHMVRATRRLEPIVIAWFFATVLIMVALVMNADAFPDRSLALLAGSSLLIWPMLGASGGFPGRLVAICAVWCCALVVATGWVFFRPEISAFPPTVLLPLALLASAAIISSAVRRASMEHRSAAVIDTLTGMLNRAALRTRVIELEHQSRVTGECVGVLVFDLDHFKQVNDVHGHAMGDRVLSGVAYRLRRSLRAFDLAYRVGGEEFVILLPGATVAAAEALAHHLWSAVRDEAVVGLRVTVSVGVAVSEGRERFDFDETFHAADEALYAAKRGGRDRIELADGHRLSAAA
ncbi:MAG: GGDEF domain-containing protein [Solirubrobacteraceae bacterium]|nr:GGDEF domain-containing protein [Solirubrobacteraceae bacterium]